MTKKLTEQWRSGNLKKSFYYLKFPDTETAEIYNLYDMEKFRYVQDSEKIKVLAEVPNYDEWQESQIKRALWFEEKEKIRNKLNDKIKLLKEQLDYALETMDQIVKRSDNTVDFVQYEHAIYLINERLKEMEDVK